MNRRDSYRICTRKRKYSIREAKRIADRVNEREDRYVVREYPCPVCNAWHIGGVKPPVLSNSINFI